MLFSINGIVHDTDTYGIPEGQDADDHVRLFVWYRRSYDKCTGCTEARCTFNEIECNCSVKS